MWVGENASMFLAMRFLHSGKITLVEKVLRRIELQKIHKPSDNALVNKNRKSRDENAMAKYNEKSWRIRASF